MTTHKIIFGDSREVLQELKGPPISLVVTSPPYFVAREYEQYLKDSTDYWEMLRQVFMLAAELLEPYGKIAVNFPDRYANSKMYGRPIEVLYAHEFNAIMVTWFLDLWARIIWDKQKVFIDGATHLAAPSNKTGQMRVAPNWEYIFVWRKYNPNIEGKTPVPIKEVDMTDKERIEWTDSIWSFPSVSVNEKEKGFKLAKFPEELPRRLIKMYSQPGDTILDPFGGTCTVTKVAAELGRNSICIEKNPVMEDYIRQYIESVNTPMFKVDASFEYIHTER